MSVRSFDDGAALCQTVPGATALQMAAYVGLSVRGVAGAAVSFAGFALPAFGLMLALSMVYAHTQNLPGVVSIFNGLQAVVVTLVANAALTFGGSALKHWRHVPITFLAILLFSLGTHPFLVVLLAALLGFWILKEEISIAPAVEPSAPMPHTTKAVMIIFCAAAILLAALRYLDPQLYEFATVMIRVDLFAFGGGFASVPVLFNEVVTVRQWLDGPTLLDGILLGQFTPGPIVITATFVGCLLYGRSER